MLNHAFRTGLTLIQPRGDRHDSKRPAELHSVGVWTGSTALNRHNRPGGALSQIFRPDILASSLCNNCSLHFALMRPDIPRVASLPAMARLPAAGLVQFDRPSLSGTRHGPQRRPDCGSGPDDRSPSGRGGAVNPNLVARDAHAGRRHRHAAAAAVAPSQTDEYELEAA